MMIMVTVVVVMMVVMVMVVVVVMMVMMVVVGACVKTLHSAGLSSAWSLSSLQQEQEQKKQ